MLRFLTMGCASFRLKSPATVKSYHAALPAVKDFLVPIFSPAVLEDFMITPVELVVG